MQKGNLELKTCKTGYGDHAFVNMRLQTIKNKKNMNGQTRSIDVKSNVRMKGYLRVKECIGQRLREN